MTTHSRNTPQQVLTQQTIDAANRQLDRIEAQQHEAKQLYTEHEQHAAWLLRCIEEAQRLASAMIEASRALESEAE